MATAGQRRRHLRHFRERKDVLTVYDDNELVKRFRFDRAGIIYLTDLVRDCLQSPTERNYAISPELKIAITLRYLATGKMQMCNGDDLGPSQSTISCVINDTLNALTSPSIVQQFVQFPVNVRDIQRKQAAFMNIAGFPGVIGVIDGTHVRITAPHDNEAEYVNRKHFHSINTQIVFDADHYILDVIAKWPGSTHDARMLNESGLKVLFERNYMPTSCHLLGDSGYPCKRWLLTPFLRPLPGPQTDYNRYDVCLFCLPRDT